MAVVNVACPYCGEEANASLPRDAKLYDVKKKSKHCQGNGTSTTSCKNCGHTFATSYTRN
ncbi:hypothetical protein HLRTI_002322 [Halorhabdus tiamatea SARL4B]|uniref:Uncharacterized protein n=1 Tax=Halorhabdus tiamatea SARL4B TaxID=1033806 RepID=U2F625_9EURY|nr:hypothetical protein HLRTI_002322 [Halorhabdus tiamatea SARL4B]